MTISREQAIQTLSKYVAPAITKAQQNTPSNIADFAHKKYYISNTNYPIQLMPHQTSLLNYAFDPANDIQTIIYSTVKKSGKTAISGLVARWVAETWGTKNEIYLVANDLEQARGRAYQAALESIEVTPGYDSVKRLLPGQWKILDRQATYIPNGSMIRAISSDYKGEAGSNPTATFWSELWAYSSEASRRLWDELTPVPTRSRSIRYVETYAGYEGESDILLELYKLGLKGQRLTHDDINWPFDDQPPVYINKSARLFMYWDDGPIARRMPWQTPEYYSAQAAVLRPPAFDRLHNNYWTSSKGDFIPTEWWHGCKSPTPVPPLDSRMPIVLGVDAAVSNDCCAIVGVSRNPDQPDNVVLRLTYVWTPPTNGTIDLDASVGATLRTLCSLYNVVQIAYDAYQLHSIMTNIQREAIAWCKPFNQVGDRHRADKQLYDFIRDRRITHDGGTAAVQIADHIKNAAAKQSTEEDTKLRIIKRTAAGKIDSVVALSMAVHECIRLNL